MNKLYYHFIFWTICLSFEVYIEFAWIKGAYPYIDLWQQLAKGILGELMLFLIKIPVTYLSFYIIDKYVLNERNNKKAFLLLALVFISGALFSHFLIVRVTFPFIYSSGVRPFLSGRIINSFIDLVFIAGIANAVMQYRYQIILREREKNLIKEKLTAELVFLKAQINPHFLFNTLNSLYALARKKSDQTAEVILKLSTLLRFMLYEAAGEDIAVSQEISIIENYIELEKIRYNERLSIEFNKNIDEGYFKIAPLILLTFVENAFKHGVSETRFNSFIRINLVLKNDGTLSFAVENSKEDGDNNPPVENIGLKNVKRQLELTYSEYKLTVNNGIDRFKIDLKINLNAKL